jgi:hypothetical protein
MQASVFILSAITALLCSLLLFRSYFNNGARLLLWSALCFVALTADNVLLFVDTTLLFPDVEVLKLTRKLITLSGLALLIYGLIWDVK